MLRAPGLRPLRGADPSPARAERHLRCCRRRSAGPRHTTSAFRLRGDLLRERPSGHSELLKGSQDPGSAHVRELRWLGGRWALMESNL